MSNDALTRGERITFEYPKGRGYKIKFVGIVLGQAYMHVSANTFIVILAEDSTGESGTYNLSETEVTSLGMATTEQLLTHKCKEVRAIAGVE